MRDLQRRRQASRRDELRRLAGQLQGRWGRRGRRRVPPPPGGAAERLHLHGAQALLPQPLVVAALQPALQEAAEAAEQDDQRPHQPEAGEAGQEGVGALRHHHGDEKAGGGRAESSQRGDFWGDETEKKTISGTFITFWDKKM